MRKLPLFVCAAAVLTLTTMTNTSYAATLNSCNLSGGNGIVIGGGSFGDLKTVLGNLGGTFCGSWKGGDGNRFCLDNWQEGSGNNFCPDVWQEGNGNNFCPDVWQGGNGNNFCPDGWQGGNGNNFCPDIWQGGNDNSFENGKPGNPGDNIGGGEEKPGIPDTDQPGNDSTQDAFAAEVVNLVNQERAKAGLSPLTIHTQAESAAAVRAKEIERSFSHTRPDGSSFYTALTSAGIRYQSAGENIAYGQMTPREVMDSWMNSSGHRANILNGNYTSIAVSHYQNGAGVHYWVQLFLK